MRQIVGYDSRGDKSVLKCIPVPNSLGEQAILINISASSGDPICNRMISPAAPNQGDKVICIVTTIVRGLSPKFVGTSHLLPAGGGGAVIFRGGGLEIFLVMYLGEGGVFCQVLGGGSDVFHWSFFSLKVIASGGGGGAQPPRPPYIPAL